MNQTTVITLTTLAFILLLIGAMIPAPMARLAVVGVGTLVAVAPIGWGTTALRVAGILLVAGGLGLAADAWPEAGKELGRHIRHARTG